MIAKNYSKQKSEQSQSINQKPPKETCKQYISVVCFYDFKLFNESKAAYECLKVVGHKTNRESRLELAPQSTDRYKGRTTRIAIDSEGRVITDKEGRKVKEKCLTGFFETASGNEDKSSGSSSVLVDDEINDSAVLERIKEIEAYYNDLPDIDKKVLCMDCALLINMADIARIISNGNALNFKSNYKRVYAIINKHTDAVGSIISRKGN